MILRRDLIKKGKDIGKPRKPGKGSLERGEVERERSSEENKGASVE